MVGRARIGGRALADLLPDRAPTGPAYAALADGITALVRDGRVAVDTRLPSERELAGALRVSRATVTAAYDALRESGFVVSRTGSGTVAAVPADAEVRHAFVRWTTDATDDPIDLSYASLPAPVEAVTAATASAAEQLAPHLRRDGYEPLGLPELRAAVAARFTDRGAATRPEQILITNGALHGLDLVLRLLLDPGNCVLVDLPTYPGALDVIRHDGARVLPVPLAASGGWDVPALAAAFGQGTPRLAYLIPDFHNPTGALVPDHDRRAVLAAARRARTTVIVDESFVELGLTDESAPPAAALDREVITIGSLSKPVWAGLRIGWVRASTELVRRLAALRASLDMGSPVLDQLVATTMIADLDTVLTRRRAEITDRRDALAAAVRDRLPGWRFELPAGGLSLWAELPAPVSTPLTTLAGPAGVLLVPGPRFGVAGTLERFVRLPFALPPDRLTEAVRRLARVWASLDRHAVEPTGRLIAT